MTEVLRRAVIQGVAGRFGLPVYGQAVPQGGKRPCFTVEMTGVEQKRLLNRRSRVTAAFAVCYYPAEGAERPAAQAAEFLRIADGLYEALFLVGDEEKFAASKMQHEKREDDGRLRFTVEYEYHIVYDEDIPLMERLEYNGKRTVGYEEESGIQQGTADDKQDVRLQR